MPHPSLAVDPHEAFEAPGADRPRRCAYASPTGAVFVCDQRGWLSRIDGAHPPGSSPLHERGRYQLLAVGLTAADCAAIRRAWSAPPGLTEARAAQGAVVAQITAERAAALGRRLRGLRRGDPSPGTVCAYNAADLVVRLPDGSGWSPTIGGELAPETPGWSWEWAKSMRFTHEVARDLDDVQCRALVDATSRVEGTKAKRAEADRHLREKGLA